MRASACAAYAQCAYITITQQRLGSLSLFCMLPISRGLRYKCRRRHGAEKTCKGNVDEGLATIEAVYRLCKAVDPSGQYDDLLWYFVYTVGLVAKQGSWKAKRNLQALGVTGDHLSAADSGAGSL